MLKGWVEICAYCRYSKYTIRRWVKTKNFPVYLGFGVRPPISSKKLIDSWLISNIEQQKEKKVRK
jgi:hypothetical protein